MILKLRVYNTLEVCYTLGKHFTKGMKQIMKRVKLLLTMAVIVFAMTIFCTMSAFALTDGEWEFQLLDNEVTITDYFGNGGKVVIPDTIYGVPVTSMDAHLFKDKPEIVSITFPSTMKKIPYQCFNSLVGNRKGTLEEIILPEGIEEIGWQAFYGAKKVKNIVLPSTLKIIGDQAFTECASLSTINFPDGLESIGEYALKGTMIETLDLSNTKATISKESFAGCLNLTSVILNDAITTIPPSAFYGCKNLKDVTIPDSVTSIGGRAFQKTAIESIVLPTSLKKINEYSAFAESKLKEVVIPYGCKFIGGNTFEKCNDLEGVYIPDTVTSIGILSIVKDCPKAIVYCSSDSYTAKHCKENKISYLTDNSVNSGIHVVYNGTRISFHSYGQNPELLEGRTLVPLRSIFEAMGANVEWDGATSTAIAKRGNVEVKITIGASEIYKNGEVVPVDVPAQLMNSRTMVPARVIAEAFGADVQWNGSGRIVLITE